MTKAKITTRHAMLTRFLHGALAIAIVLQLGSSQFMDPDKGGNTAFSVHQYLGLAAFGLVLLFWVFAVVRKRGTPLGEDSTCRLHASLSLKAAA